jgi:hypothetical protein
LVAARALTSVVVASPRLRESQPRRNQAAPATQNRHNLGGRASPGREGRGNESSVSASQSDVSQSEGERYASLSAFSKEKSFRIQTLLLIFRVVQQ